MLPDAAYAALEAVGQAAFVSAAMGAREPRCCRVSAAPLGFRQICRFFYRERRYARPPLAAFASMAASTTAHGLRDIADYGVDVTRI